VIGGFPVGTTAPTLSKVFFPSNTVGYVSGNRGAVYKTINGGTTWTDISPFPALNTTMNYTEIFALDDNTVFVTGNGFPRKVVYRSVNGGTTWTDITNNLATLPVGNLNAILMHDVNNGYVGTPGSMVSTNNGGATWNMEIPPTGNIFETMAFAPKTVPAGTPVANRRLFVTGVNVSGAPLMEFGDTTLLKVSTTETSTPSCSSTPTGTITITAQGGIAPYSYSLNGGAFQSSNVLIGAAAGNNTVIIKDNACESITKTVVVDVLPAPLVNAGPDKVIVAGEEIGLWGSSAATAKSIAWTPPIYITSGALSYITYVNPPTTTTYKLTVVDAITGCAGSDEVLVTVAPYCIAVKNAFTPNGDGQNDKWLVTNGGACTKSIAVKVFNRYGQLVFRNDNYQNNWEGTNDGKPIPDGTYYYVITYDLVSGKTFQTKGDVTILR
jgi:gliding motility-associated-like protein